ncbi:hypothetical protein [Roseiconus nitratireducens]|nr:hypothetical protein [Roseiconus nitratireducens]
MPAEAGLRRWTTKLIQRVRGKEENPFVARDKLRLASSDRLDRLVPPPACGPLLREMQETFADWIEEPEPSNWMQLVVLPPCDRNNLVQQWAEQQQFEVVAAPQRDRILTAGDASELPAVELPAVESAAAQGEHVLVIPRLEQWFLRHRRGLDLVRCLLDRLALLRRHCVVGCNSWAWGFLSRAVGADLALPHPVTFESFTTDRLQGWFGELAENGETEARTFRRSLDGKDIFATNEDGAPQSDYLATLAAQSFGIPWIAWHLWRSSLRLGPKPEDGGEEKFPDEQTLWVTEPEEFDLPASHRGSALLTLHALLLHDTLTAEQVHTVLPSIDESNLLTALINNGFVEQENDHFRCRAVAYPTIRRALNDAGFPMDRL